MPVFICMHVTSEIEASKYKTVIMTKKEEALSVKRGVTLPLTVPTTITYDDLLNKAVEKHHRFNKDIIKQGNKTFYYLLYGDKNKANTLPGCNEPFTLNRYIKRKLTSHIHQNNFVFVAMFRLTWTSSGMILNLILTLIDQFMMHSEEMWTSCVG